MLKLILYHERYNNSKQKSTDMLATWHQQYYFRGRRNEIYFKTINQSTETRHHSSHLNPSECNSKIEIYLQFPPSLSPQKLYLLSWCSHFLDISRYHYKYHDVDNFGCKYEHVSVLLFSPGWLMNTRFLSSRSFCQ